MIEEAELLEDSTDHSFLDSRLRLNSDVVEAEEAATNFYRSRGLSDQIMTSLGSMEVEQCRFLVKNTEMNSDSNGKKFVSYSIEVINRQSPLHASLIKRRYSDFRRYYTGLKKRFPDVLKSYKLPTKLLVGNFSERNIDQRSKAFETLLSLTWPVEAVRDSPEFSSFFYEGDTRAAMKLMKEGDVLRALPSLLDILNRRIKLQGSSGGQESLTSLMCAIAVCYHKAGDITRALNYGNRCLIGCLGGYDVDPDSESNAFFVPLLRDLIGWTRSIGGDVTVLEERLNRCLTRDDLRCRGLIDGKPKKLVDLIFEECMST